MANNSKHYANNLRFCVPRFLRRDWFINGTTNELSEIRFGGVLCPTTVVRLNESGDYTRAQQPNHWLKSL